MELFTEIVYGAGAVIFALVIVSFLVVLLIQAASLILGTLLNIVLWLQMALHAAHRKGHELLTRNKEG